MGAEVSGILGRSRFSRTEVTPAFEGLGAPWGWRGRSLLCGGVDA
ncbi:hypothetical protein [Geitlerinema sp. PCC 7407]|nr:hypothetical protein [Geitlerinema sp. PCC 7407]